MRTRHDSNIDPFNAGEPVMPEDTLQDDFSGDACSFANHSYSAPQKRPDSYRAPTDDSPAGAAGRDSNAASKRPSRPWRAAFKANSNKSNRKPRTADLAPSNSPKRAARRNKVAIVILALFILGTAGDLLGSILSDVSLPPSFDNAFFTYDEDSSSHSQADELDPTELDKEDRAVYDATDQALSDLQDNENVRKRICDDFSQELESSCGYSAEELGIDPSPYADRLLNSFTYQIDSVYAFTDFDDSSDNRGTAFFDYFVPDTYDFAETLHEELNDYLYDEGLTSAHSELTDAQKEHVRELYNTALDEIEDDDNESSYGSLEFDYDYSSKTFSLKQKSLDELIEAAFNLY